MRSSGLKRHTTATETEVAPARAGFSAEGHIVVWSTKVAQTLQLVTETGVIVWEQHAAANGGQGIGPGPTEGKTGRTAPLFVAPEGASVRFKTTLAGDASCHLTFDYQ